METGLGGQGGDEKKMTVQNGISRLSPSFCCSEPKPLGLCQPGDLALRKRHAHLGHTGEGKAEDLWPRELALVVGGLPWFPLFSLTYGVLLPHRLQLQHRSCGCWWSLWRRQNQTGAGLG